MVRKEDKLELKNYLFKKQQELLEKYLQKQEIIIKDSPNE